MISAWWLILIIPFTFLCGYCLCGVLSSNSEQERCLACRRKQAEKNKEAK